MIDASLFLRVFPDPLQIRAWTPVELQAGGYETQQYTLLDDFTFNGPHGSFTIPAGFQTDFASIPRPAFWWMDPEDPRIMYPSVAHDWAYSTTGKVSDVLTLTREQADDSLEYAMGVCGARWDQRKIVLGAVRVGGSSHWNTKPLAA